MDWQRIHKFDAFLSNSIARKTSDRTDTDTRPFHREASLHVSWYSLFPKQQHRIFYNDTFWWLSWSLGRGTQSSECGSEVDDQSVNCNRHSLKRRGKFVMNIKGIKEMLRLFRVGKKWRVWQLTLTCFDSWHFSKTDLLWKLILAFLTVDIFWQLKHFDSWHV